MVTRTTAKKAATETRIQAWHWVTTNEQGHPILRDGTLVETGRTYRLPDGQSPVLCERGFHASVRAIDALLYAPDRDHRRGAIICRVELSGKIIQGDDKLVASERTVLWWADATRVQHLFACRLAEDALIREREAGREPDERSWRALAIKRAWLDGQATNEELDAAGTAARAATWDATWAAARAATWDATWTAARAATWDATWTAARAAAWTAARAAARDAAWAAAWAAARDAACQAAAWDATGTKYDDWLEEMLAALEPTEVAHAEKEQT